MTTEPHRPLRVLDVVSTLDPRAGGVSEGVRQIAAHQAAAGHLQEVLTMDAPGSEWLRGFPVPVHAIGPTRLGRWGYTARLVPWLRARAAQYDVIVVQGLWQYHGLGTWRALRGGPVPYCVFPHGMLDPWFRHAHPAKHLKKQLYWPWAEHRVLRDAHAVLFTAQEEARLAAQSFRPYRVRAEVVGYGTAVDDTAAVADAAVLLRGHPELRGRRILLFMGRIHPKKGCDLLIDAFAGVARAHPGLHLVMAGPDQVGWQAALQRRARELAVDDRITWTGMLGGELKWAALRAAEAFVLPSHQENFGIAVAEALAFGVPVLLSHRVNTWREVVNAGAGLAEDDTAEATTRLLRRWLALPSGERQAMRARARACYASHFHVASVAERLTGVWRTTSSPVSRRIHGHATNDPQTAKSVT